MLVVLPAVPQHSVLEPHDGRVAPVGLLAAGDRVLADREGLPTDVHRATLEGHAERVAVQLLQQTAPRAEVHAIGAEAVGEQARQHVGEGVQRHSVALQDTELLADATPEGVALLHAHFQADFLHNLRVLLRVDVALGEDGREGAELVVPVLVQHHVQDCEELRQRLDTLARVWADQRELPLGQALRQHGPHGGASVGVVVGRPEAHHGVPDVEAVADQGDCEARHVLLDHVGEGVVLGLLVLGRVALRGHVGPRRDRGVLRGGHARCAVPLLEDRLEAALGVVVLEEHP
mmetsp:Transcript_64826/g.163285  ORF Transcript_64826/g.163285 Transcript_64826/m.163285 type:complete len:290 (+) Transcript_64826:678-1547(+)